MKEKKRGLLAVPPRKPQANPKGWIVSEIEQKWDFTIVSSAFISLLSFALGELRLREKENGEDDSRLADVDGQIWGRNRKRSPRVNRRIPSSSCHGSLRLGRGHRFDLCLGIRFLSSRCFVVALWSLESLRR